MKYKLYCLVFVMMALAFPVRVLAYDFSAVAPSGQTLYYLIINSSNNVAVCGGKALTGDLVIPESVTYNGTTYSVTAIGGSAFSYCSGLTSITIPNSVTTIGYGAFSYCSGLTSVTIPNSVTTIGYYAFSYCSGLTSITIPNSVTEIGGSAFESCSSLNNVTIGKSVTSIGSNCFAGCINLHAIVSKAVYPPTCGTDVFEDVPGYCTLTVPCGSKTYYSLQTPWDEFALIDENCGEAIDETDSDGTVVYTRDGRIVVEGASNETVSVWDISGRQVYSGTYGDVNYVVPTSGVYVVRIGNHPARKVVVIR